MPPYPRPLFLYASQSYRNHSSSYCQRLLVDSYNGQSAMGAATQAFHQCCLRRAVALHVYSRWVAHLFISMDHLIFITMLSSAMFIRGSWTSAAFRITRDGFVPACDSVHIASPCICYLCYRIFSNGCRHGLTSHVYGTALLASPIDQSRNPFPHHSPLPVRVSPPNTISQTTQVHVRHSTSTVIEEGNAHCPYLRPTRQPQVFALSPREDF